MCQYSSLQHSRSWIEMMKVNRNKDVSKLSIQSSRTLEQDK